MAAGKDEPLSLRQAAKLLGMSDRGTAKLLRQGKLVEYEGPMPPRERGRPPILVTRSSVAEYARAAGRLLREMSPEEARGRHAGLSRWLNDQDRLTTKLRRGRVVLIDGEGSGGQVWVRFLSTRSKGREILGSFWRQDVRGLFGSRKFRVTFDGKKADVYVRSTDEELDSVELARCVNAAVNCVNKERARLSEERSRESRG